MEKIKAKWTQVSLKNVLKVKDPKLSRVLIVQNNVYAAVHGAIGEYRLQKNRAVLRWFLPYFKEKENYTAA